MNNKNNDEEVSNLDICSICLERPLYPAKIPCGHIFCYLCAKGAILNNNQCPLCRQVMRLDEFNNQTIMLGNFVPEVNNDFFWFYEGFNGWWLYDKETSSQIEQHYQNSQLIFELLIAGAIYTIDLERMIQFRKDFPNKIRKLKRDRLQLDQSTKGIAGIPIV